MHVFVLQHHVEHSSTLGHDIVGESARHYFKGFMDQEWQITDEVAVESLSFLPCGDKRYLNVNTELKVDAGWATKTTTNFMTMDSADGNLETIYRVSWQQCPA